MKPVLNALQMREADRRTIEDFGLPGFSLMETAGRAATREIAAHFGPPDELSVCCMCGKGNNGGDGLVVARLLADAGADVHVQMVLGLDGLSPDAQKNLSVLTELQTADASLMVTISSGTDLVDAGFDLLVDAILGTGLSAPLRDPVSNAVKSINDSGIPVVSIDVPTGLNADTGTIMGDCVIADMTVTMGALKQGLLFNDGPRCSGEIIVAEIGIPRCALAGENGTSPTKTWLIEHDDVADVLPRRARDAHKYSAGMLLAIAGSPGLTGAPTLASTAAARTGAGAVVCACPQTVQATLAGRLTEVMTLALPVSADGLMPADSMQAIQSRTAQAAAALIGCGLGRLKGTGEFVRNFLQSVDLPTVVDADALFALDEAFLLKYGRPHWVLTPHVGEFRRLAGDTPGPIDAARTARAFAKKWNVTIILKGAPSVVGCTDGSVFVSPTGNQALASAGTGDVLAGMCAGYLAQGLRPVDAAIAALFVGGRTVEKYSDQCFRDSLMAGDIIDLLPQVLAEFST
jgi:NAD(P)H-hydrate epimerase